MSRPPPEDQVPLQQILPPGAIDAIWVVEGLLLLGVFGGFILLVFKICFQVSRSIHHGEKIQLFPTSSPIQKLTYFVPPAFYRYLYQRDGWRGDLPPFVVMALFPLFGAFVFSGAQQTFTHYIIVYLLVFFAFGGLNYLGRYLLRKDGKSITFYRDGIGNRSKGRRTPYDFFKKVTVSTIRFEETTLNVISFTPRRPTLDKTKTEYAFDAKTDIGPLLTQIRESGLLIEGTIDDASMTDLR